MENAFEVGRHIEIEFADGEIGGFTVMADDLRGLLARAGGSNEVLFMPWDNIISVTFYESDDDPRP